MSRICNTCNQDLEITKFKKTGTSKKYWARTCRSCDHKKWLKNPRYRMSRMLSMAKLRCNDPKNDSYSRYGGRGIKFLIDRETFYAKFEKKVQSYIDAGVSPSIDRVDHNGHYEMDNVQVIPQIANVAEMRVRAKETFKQRRILREQAPTKECVTCSVIVPTTDYYISKRHKDGTITRYGSCPDCERQKKADWYAKLESEGRWDPAARAVKKRR